MVVYPAKPFCLASTVTVASRGPPCLLIHSRCQAPVGSRIRMVVSVVPSPGGSGRAHATSDSTASARSAWIARRDLRSRDRESTRSVAITSRSYPRTLIAMARCESNHREVLMKVMMLSMMGVAGLGACGVADTETVGEATQEILYHNDIFYDNFNSLAPGPIAGQGGWESSPGAVSSCVVTTASNTDKNLDCTKDGGTNGQGALHRFVTPANRDYHFQFDVWMNGVHDATHGKVFLESGAGTGGSAIFQIASGCSPDNMGIYHAGIRVTFEYAGPVAPLLTDVDCNGHYRFACIWTDQASQLRCGAARLPADPLERDFQLINTPEPIGSFNLVRVLGGIGMRDGVTTFDKVQVLSD